MKSLLLFLSLAFSFQVMAISDAAIEKACFDRGVEKLVQQAEAYGCEIRTDEVRVSEVDNRWWNPSKYIWYTVETTGCDMDQLTKLVQYYRGKCL
jgi:hypothetical protein